ncbi:MAG: hypothetical protein IKR73_06105 [Oscillospiraceae bacterium]|nr:hypothetical protein [Oscillospiraceae bacterium]
MGTSKKKKTAAENVIEAAADIIKDVASGKDVTEAVADKAAETAAAITGAEKPAAKAAAKKTAAKRPAAKKTAAKATEKKPAAKKTAAKAEAKAEAKAPEKPAAAKKPAAKKATTEKKETLVYQVKNNNYTTEDIIAKCKDAYRGGTRKVIKTIDVYVKSSKAYFVVNGKDKDDEGKAFCIDL